MMDDGQTAPESVGLGDASRVPASLRPSLVARLRRRLLGISVSETRVERRGFYSEDPARDARLVRVGETFLTGYHAALLDPRPESLAQRLDAETELGWRSFAYEGAGMGLALQDALFPRRFRRPSRLHELLAGPGAPHRYLILVGSGWTLSRLPRRYGKVLAGLDPVLRWLVFDGFGFHHGFFGWRRSIEARRVPRRLSGYARHVFDQGLGRSLWFVQGMSPERIAATVASFPAERRGGLWSGVGLASAFAGGQSAAGLEELRRRAGPSLPDLAQGVAFAAEARMSAGEGTPWLETACEVLCGASAAELAALTGRLGAGLPDDGGRLTAAVPAYETWRRRTREALSAVSCSGAAPGDRNRASRRSAHARHAPS